MMSAPFGSNSVDSSSDSEPEDIVKRKNKAKDVKKNGK